MARLRVTVAGALSLERGRRRVGHRAFGGTQLPVVAAVLILRRAAPVALEALANELWPEQPPDRWRVAVRGLVSRVRRLLEEVGCDDDVIVATGGAYVVQLGEVEVDVETVAGSVEQAIQLLAAGRVDAAGTHASAARQVASRPVLPGIDAPVLTELRSRLRHERLEALRVLAECRRQAGAYGDAATVALEAVELEPFRESTWRHLLTVQADAGNVAAALRDYERMRDLFVRELGVDPSPETQQLHASLLKRTDAGVDTATDVGVSEPGIDSGAGERIPYRGLLAFGEHDADLFFGRDAQVQEVLDRLNHAHAVAVTGASGSGKSSLVRAGLLPALAAGALPDADTWVTVVISPGGQPAKALGAALMEEGQLAPTLMSQLWDEEDPLGRAARAVLDSRGASAKARLLVVVDQAEELFTVCDDGAERERFLTTLLGAVRRPDSVVRLMFTLRSDFYSLATKVPDLAELLSTSQCVLPPLDGAGHEAAIVGPAHAVGVGLEEGLVGRILADVGNEPGSLPLLQHALLELWNRRADGMLTVKAYNDVGGVAGALAHRAEAVYQRLAPEERALSRRLLLRVVQPGRGTGDTRRRVPLGELRQDPARDDVVDDVVARLVDARLLTTTAGSAREPVVEVAHVALVQGWPRLARWVDDSRADLVAVRRVAEAAGRWQDADREPEYLLGGGPLAEATQLRDRAPTLLNPSEDAFLQASIDRSRELVRRRSRQRRRAFAALGLAAVLAVALAVVSIGQRDQARVAEQRARSRLLAAASQEQLGQDADLALLLALEAVSATGSQQATTGAALAALNQAVAAHRIVQQIPDAGIVAGFTDHGRLLTETAVWDIASAAAVTPLEPPPSEASWDMAMSPDGRWLAMVFGTEDPEAVGAGSQTPDTTVWDLGTGRITSRIPAAADVQDQPSFSPDGQLLAVVDRPFQPDASDWSVSVYDVERGERMLEIPIEGISHRTAFSQDGRLLAVADGAAPTVRLYDVRSGAPVRELSRASTGGWASGVAFHPDGEHVAVLLQGEPGIPAQVLYYSLDLAEPRLTLPLEGENPWNLCISGDGSTLAVLTPAERIEVFDLPGGALRMVLAGNHLDGPPVCGPRGDRVAATNTTRDSAMVWDVTGQGSPSVWASLAAPAWTATWVDGGVVTTHADRRIRRWEGGIEVAATGPELHDEPPWNIVASPDGRYVATNAAPPDGARPDAYPLLGDGRLLLRDARTLEVVRELRPGGWPFGFSLDSSRFLTGSFFDQQAIFVVDVASGQPTLDVSIPQVHEFANWPAAAFLQDGRHVIVQQLDRAAIHDMETGQVVTATCPWGRGVPVASPDGQLLAVFSDRHGAVLIHDVPRLLALAADPDDCTPGDPSPSDAAIVARIPLRNPAGFGFSPDGARFVTADGLTHDMSVWDPHSGELLLSLPHDGRVAGPTFTPDGTRVALVHRDRDGRQWVRLYSLDVDRLTHLARPKVTRDFTADECREYDLGPDCGGSSDDTAASITEARG